MAWMILAVKAVVVVPGVPTVTTWSPTLISDSFALVTFPSILDVMVVEEVVLMVRVSFLRVSMVKEEALVSVTRPKIAWRLSAPGLVITSRRLAVRVFWLSTSPILMTKSPTLRSAKVPSFPPVSLIVVLPVTTAVRGWFLRLVMVMVASDLAEIVPTKARLATEVLMASTLSFTA